MSWLSEVHVHVLDIFLVKFTVFSQIVSVAKNALACDFTVYNGNVHSVHSMVHIYYVHVMKFVCSMVYMYYVMKYVPSMWYTYTIHVMKFVHSMVYINTVL